MAIEMPNFPRIAYDDPNVAQVFLRSDRNYGTGYEWAQASPEGVRAMNSDPLRRRIAFIPYEFYGYSQTADEGVVAILFVRPMRIRAYSVIAHNKNAGFGNLAAGEWDYLTEALLSSQDTTNGVDGIWRTERENLPPRNIDQGSFPLGTNFLSADPLVAGFSERSGSSARDYTRSASSIYENATLSDMRSVRGLKLIFRGGRFGIFGGGSGNNSHDGVLGVLLWGEPEPDPVTDRLEFWRALTNFPLDGDDLQWGDIDLGTAATKTFRLKNQSETHTAGSVVVSVESFKEPSPASSAQLSLSLDGSAWGSTVSVASISPGATSPVIYVRRVTPFNSPLGLLSPRVRADVGAWS